MTSVRIRTCAVGAALAVSAGVLVDHGAVLGKDLPHVAALGLASGAVLGLVPGRSAAGKLGSYVTGFVAVMVALSLLKTTLPDIPMGRALAAVVVVSIVTAVSAATAERLPLWAALLGVATLTGAFQTILAANPAVGTGDTTTTLTAATTALTASAVAFLITDVLTAFGTRTDGEGDSASEIAMPSPRSAADAAVTTDKAAR